jgi:FixJ family two-component response regulator
MFVEELKRSTSTGGGFAERFIQRINGTERQSSDMSRLIPIVFIVDDDSSVRERLEFVIQSAGWQPKTFACAEQFLDCPPVVAPNCLLIDASLPNTNALDLQKRVASERPGTSIILIAAHIDVVTAVEVMKAGAVGIFMKPLSETPVLTTIREALERSRISLAREDKIRAIRARYRGLSQREQEVMILVVAGMLNKQVGGELHITERTVKAHRGQVMQKMKADSLPHLVKMAAELGLPVGEAMTC